MREKKSWTLKSIKDGIIIVCEKLQRIPTQKELKKYNEVPSCAKTINAYMVQDGYKNYHDFCIKKGFVVDKTNLFSYTYDSVCKIFDDFYSEYGFYPNSNNTLKQEFNIYVPTWKSIRNACGDKFIEFCDKYKIKNIKNLSYQEYCNRFIEISIKNGGALLYYELLKNEYGLPTGNWFVSHCPDINVSNYSQFISYLGLKPRFEVTKEHATIEIMKKYSQLKRNLNIKDFSNPIDDEVGISTISRIWGSFNKMLKDLGLKVTIEDMTGRHREINNLIYDIVKLCNHIEKTEGRRVISRKDVDECEWCLSYQAYERWFKKILGMSLVKFIDSIGFVSIKSGMGMNHIFDDGEKTSSRFEFNATTFLKENKIKYLRNVKYKDFIPNYKDKKDCDYVIEINDKKIYLEIAGMADPTKKPNEDKILIKYLKDLSQKEKMLIENKLNYKILYPADFKRPLGDVFSFLFTEIKKVV